MFWSTSIGDHEEIFKIEKLKWKCMYATTKKLERKLKISTSVSRGENNERTQNKMANFIQNFQINHNIFKD